MTPRMLWSIPCMIKIFQERCDYLNKFIYPQTKVLLTFLLQEQVSGWKTIYRKIASTLKYLLSKEVQ